MWNKLVQIWKIKELRNSILFVLAMLTIYRFAAHIPIPGVDTEALKNFFTQNQFLGLINIFSGGGMSNFSVAALGVAPYITSSIIFQLLVMIIPKLEEMSKEEAGQRKINQYTRYLTVPLGVLQAFGLITLLKQSSQPIIQDLSAYQLFVTVLIMTAGTVFLTWIGELISERKIGNGISLMIFAGIIAVLPTAVQQTLVVFDYSQVFNIVMFIIIALVTTVGVVIITEGQRKIPVSYAKIVRGNRMFGGG